MLDVCFNATLGAQQPRQIKIHERWRQGSDQGEDGADSRNVHRLTALLNCGNNRGSNSIGENNPTNAANEPWWCSG